MIERLAALILLSTVHLIQAAACLHQMSYAVVEVGSSITLQCPIAESKGRFFQWYKLPLGDMVQTVATGSYTQQTLGAEFHESRFKVTDEEAHYLLTITNVSKEDEATYFCRSGTAYSPNAANVTFLAVNDTKQQKSIKVNQSPETASVEPGGSVTLHCSLLSKNKDNRVQCPGEHSVYWFRPGSGKSHPAIIYAHRNRSYDQKERSCVYSLSQTVRDSSDTGTYYCAVVTCGQILFGEGTQVQTRPELDPVVLVLGALLACCVAVIVGLIFYVRKVRRRLIEHCKAGTKSASQKPGQDKSTVEPSADPDTEAVNYAALNFSSRKVKREKKTESPQECVYSAVRVDYHTQHPPPR